MVSWGWGRVYGVEVSSKGEMIGIDVIGGCESCTKLDDRGTCCIPTRPPLFHDF